MTTEDISSHLLADWVPSLPAAVASSFIGWPPFLVEPILFNGHNVLSLRSEAGRSERQWKSVLSWMLGVAGARHVLATEGYRWIAPLSAFYPNAAGAVDLLPDFAPLRLRGSGQLRGPGFLVHYEGESAAVAITR
jgi:hypothetical protein